MSDPTRKFPIVGIGASAGGVAALRDFFNDVPAECGMAFVIVTHLSADRESLLHEIIQRQTELPVTVAEDGQVVEKNNVYVMPSGVSLSIGNGILSVRSLSGKRDRKPIDAFLSTLAIDQGEHAVGIILSGGDGDGTLGAKAIKMHGGLTLAQTGDGSGPQQADMPRSAIKTGVIDLAVPVESMASKLADYVRGFSLLEQMGKSGEALENDLETARLKICAILGSHTGHDFSGYKPKTFLRRTRRRMQIMHIGNIDDYLDLLYRDTEEVDAFFRDLLINVTSFFRDARAFKLLETDILPKLFADKDETDTLRIWIPGCATGEEVYSIAILVREHIAQSSGAAPRIQIFATDIDEAALSVARAGRYPASLLEGVSPERRRRFFTSDDTSYVINSEIRELCIFSPHNVTRDPPFSRMDLVSCRNLLIYLGPEVQKRVIPTFHYALRPGGFLFLGTSESINQHHDLFTAVDKQNRIFQARAYSGATSRLPINLTDAVPGVDARADKPDRRGSSKLSLHHIVDLQVLERFAPPHVVVDEHGDVVHYSARTGGFLEAQQGAPNRQLLGMARRGLRFDLRTALGQAHDTGKTVVRDNVVLDQEADVTQLVRITVDPIQKRSDVADTLYLVLFETIGMRQDSHTARAENNDQDAAFELESELRETRERLQATVEEYETALEELKSSNEELISVNEEAQSTNEELEASKEEMQSLNEELSTINTELHDKVDELDRANNDLKNLFASTQIATVFLDKNLVIRNFTPAASKFFNLRPHDIGRPLTELSSTLNYSDMERDIAAVFKSGDGHDEHLHLDGEDSSYLARLLPYRGEGEKIEGVVFTLIDITQLTRAEEHQKVLNSELNHRVKNMLAVVIAVADQTLESTSSITDYHAALVGRLRAMSRAYILLSREQWREASLKEILLNGLELFETSHFSFRGPEFKVPPETGLALGMVIHELATNAAKYGALSTPKGKIDISWTVAGGHFRMEWRETAGRKIEPPQKSGFGSSLIEGEISYRLGGTVENTYEPTGLTVRLGFPVGDQKVSVS
ncbi:CheR family methyltransferase [Martelella sp. AMO21009]